jgi:hypothetical protein
MAPRSFILKAGTSSVNLAQHVNHTVEVTGSKSDDKSRGHDGASTTATRPGAPEPSTGASPHRDKPATLTANCHDTATNR